MQFGNIGVKNAIIKVDNLYKEYTSAKQKD